ncbi:MAG: outer membrane protein assembly factor BamE [Alphaproteobacteria bacterium]|nr:outer membrane protein assembly factor BamE [Alphaproteobacteria bacterium]
MSTVTRQPTSRPRSSQRARPRGYAAPRLASLALALLLAACGGIVEQRGTIPEKETISELRPGLHRREDVAAALGSPSTVATFDPNIWYYIGTTSKRVAFFNPDVQEQQVLIVRFDDQGTLDSIRRLDKTDGREITMVSRTTPTAGQSITFLQQVLGNIGRFDPDSGKTPGGTGSPTPSGRRN